MADYIGKSYASEMFENVHCSANSPVLAGSHHIRLKVCRPEKYTLFELFAFSGTQLHLKLHDAKS